MTTNLQMLASSYGRCRRFVARGYRTQTSCKVIQEDSEQWHRQRKIVVGVQNARFLVRNSVLLGIPPRKSRNDWICYKFVGHGSLSPSAMLMTVTADSGKSRSFMLCGKKHE